MYLFINRFLLIFIILVFSVSVQSEETKKKYYDSGVVQFEYSFKNGKLHGVTKEFYESGVIKAESTYKADRLIAQKKFNLNGDNEYEMRYEQGKKLEITRRYYSTGELFRKRTLVNGKLEGLEIDYYKDGNKKAERQYINGLKEGSAKGFHYNGNVQGDWQFKNGEPVSAIIYYRNGAVWLEHKDFNNKGQLDGVSKEYNKQGKLVALRFYKENEMVKRTKVGPWFRWFWSLWY
jgi:antitoxin component YwqK of YwqJK toxin-antitoxin module